MATDVKEEADNHMLQNIVPVKMEAKALKRPWRKLVKKLQRKRRRQKFARARDKKLEEEELERHKDPLYLQWLEQCEELEQIKRLGDERLQQENEELWLRRELLAQKQYQRDEQKRIAEERAQEALRMQQEQVKKAREDAIEHKRQEVKRRTEEAAKDFEDTMQLMQNYLEDEGMKTPTKLLGRIDTKPGEKLCEFYGKTHCCRFGVCCHYNHSRPMLSQCIVIRNFFQHRLLDQQIHEEYASSEERIEVSEFDLKGDYREFCEDVWPELEQFGQIINFRTVRNRLPHARGHVFVEYTNKRSALKAFINLQNRFYASKRLNVEFSHISHWRTAVCGFSLARKCPKGAYCNYLHIIPNPERKYNAPLEPMLDKSLRGKQNSDTPQETPTMSWNSVVPDDTRHRNWRWSESPEVEIPSNADKTEDKSHMKKSEENRPEQTESIVLSSSDSEEEKGKRISNTECRQNLQGKKQTSKWTHMPKVSPREKSNTDIGRTDRSERADSIYVSSSSSDEGEEEQRRKKDGKNDRKEYANEQSTRQGRKAYSRSSEQHRSSKDGHGKRSPSEERYKRSPRPSSSRHRSRSRNYRDQSR